MENLTRLNVFNFVSVGTCLVSAHNYIETTDNVVIKEEIPSTCPFVLAEDTQGEQAEWRMLLRKAEGGRQI